jgi:Zn-dependent protease with chaperone function
VALLVAGLIAARLLWTLASGFVRTSRVRSQQRAMLKVVLRPGDGGCVHVIDVADTLAFSIPGGPSMIVLSQGIVDQLRGTELAAVIAHEQAHLTVRHDLLLLPFVSWRHALPWLPSTTCAYSAVHELVELHADDSACHFVGRRSLARALARTGASSDGAPVAGSLRGATVTRVRRLSAPALPLTSLVRTVIVATAAALVIAPTAFVFGTG